jgi:hypothetical protein
VNHSKPGLAAARQNQGGFQRSRATAAEIVPDDHPFQRTHSTALSALKGG